MKDNPEGYWFKRKLFGWGWVPVRWQGWLVVAVSVAIIALGIYVGDIDDAPGAALLGILLAVALLFGFGYWKGERPKWMWGFPEERPREKYDKNSFRKDLKEDPKETGREQKVNEREDI